MLLGETNLYIRKVMKQKSMEVDGLRTGDEKTLVTLAGSVELMKKAGKPASLKDGPGATASHDIVLLVVG